MTMLQGRRGAAFMVSGIREWPGYLWPGSPWDGSPAFCGFISGRARAKVILVLLGRVSQ
jgi:hypothetical protein